MLAKEAIRYFGDVRKTAKALDISTAAVYRWASENDGIVPESSAYKIHFISRKAVKLSPEHYSD